MTLRVTELSAGTVWLVDAERRGLHSHAERGNDQAGRQRGARVPVRRPSGGVAQGDARQDAERGTMGQGRPIVTAPGAAPEGGKSGRRPDPDVGVPFSLVTFSWACKRKLLAVRAKKKLKFSAGLGNEAVFFCSGLIRILIQDEV